MHGSDAEFIYNKGIVSGVSKQSAGITALEPLILKILGLRLVAVALDISKFISTRTDIELTSSNAMIR